MPTPNTRRPPLSRSSVTVSRASWCGRRRGSGVTSAPIRDALGGHRHGGERDPGIGDGLHRRAVLHVVPDEEAVPAGRLGARGELGHQRRLGQLVEGGDEDSATGAHSARQPSRAQPWRRRSLSGRDLPTPRTTAPQLARSGRRAGRARAGATANEPLPAGAHAGEPADGGRAPRRRRPRAARAASARRRRARSAAPGGRDERSARLAPRTTAATCRRGRSERTPPTRPGRARLLRNARQVAAGAARREPEVLGPRGWRSAGVARTASTTLKPRWEPMPPSPLVVGAAADAVVAHEVVVPDRVAARIPALDVVADARVGDHVALDDVVARGRRRARRRR